MNSDSTEKDNPTKPKQSPDEIICHIKQMVRKSGKF